MHRNDRQVGSALAESADWGRGDGDAEGEDAALFAAHHAKQKGQTNEAMFAELTRAEKEYEQSHIGHGVVHGQPGGYLKPPSQSRLKVALAGNQMVHANQFSACRMLHMLVPFRSLR